MKSQEHYNFCTKSWQYIMGGNFHWGYFNEKNRALNQATNFLVELLASKLHLDRRTKIVDIGCGIGGPAIFLNQRYNSKVTGISNSKVGILIAREKKNALLPKSDVKFILRDALNTKFPNSSFDVVWIMEMAHLVENKQKLLEEAWRILKPDGKIAFCDLMLYKDLNAKEIVKNKENLIILDRVFGEAQIKTFSWYVNMFHTNGFKEIELSDISKNVIPTINAWKRNAIKNKEKIVLQSGINFYVDFCKSCVILESFYSKKQWGYGIINATK